MIEEVYDGVFKISGDSNIFFLKEENIVIDAGTPTDERIVSYEFSKITSLDKIKTVIFTHLHYDHIGNYKLFKNAEFYASKDSIESLNKDKFKTILLKPLADSFNVKLKDVETLGLPDYFKIIYTPGHTKGSFCLLDTKRKILFSGDTLFYNGYVGRTDLFTSVPEKMSDSLNKLKKLDYDILCPGHDY